MDANLTQYLFNPGSQNHRILSLLQRGPVTNVELVRDHHILKYTGRLSDVRQALRPYGVGINAERVHGGTFIYSLMGGI